MKKTIKELTGISLSHETIRKHLLVGWWILLFEWRYTTLRILLFMTNNGRKLMENGFYYYVIFDIINRIPVATYLTDSVYK